MNNNVEKALAELDTTYNELVVIANEITDSDVREIDEIISYLNDNCDSLSNEALRQSMLKLSSLSYSFCAKKEQSTFKASLAEIIRKNAYSEEFNQLSGAVAVKDNLANTKIADKLLVEELYSLVSNLLKNKLDETHRVIDTLKMLLMSRMNEAKLQQYSDSIS